MCRMSFVCGDRTLLDYFNTVSNALYGRAALEQRRQSEDEVYDFSCSFLHEGEPSLVAGGGCARKIDDDGGHSSRTFSTRHRTGCILLTCGRRERETGEGGSVLAGNRNRSMGVACLLVGNPTSDGGSSIDSLQPSGYKSIMTS